MKDEPVAWLYSVNGLANVYTRQLPEWSPDKSTEIPLYTRPAPEPADKTGNQHTPSTEGAWAGFPTSQGAEVRHAPTEPADMGAQLAAAFRAGELAMQERAAHKATSFLVGDPANDVPLHSPSPHEIAAAIRALKPKETDRGWSVCNKCGTKWPSAPVGTIHKCGSCSGGYCQNVKDESQ